MSIRTKFAAIFVALNTLTVLACGIIYMQLKEVERDYDSALDTGIPLLQISEAIGNDFDAQLIAIQMYLLTEDAKAEATFEESTKNAENTFAKFDNLVTSDEGKQISQELRTMHADFRTAVIDVAMLYDSGKKEEALAQFGTTVAPFKEKFKAITEKFSQSTFAIFDTTRQEVKQTANTSGIIAIIVSLIAVTVGIFMAVLIARKIVMPIRSLRDNVKTIAEGDFTVADLPILSKDEVGDLTDSFNQMKTMFNTLVHSLQDNAAHLSATATQLHASTIEVNETAQRVGDSSQQVTAGMLATASSASDSAVAMEQTATAVQRIAESTQTLQSTTADTEGAAKNGGTSIQAAQSQMSEIHSSTQMTSHLITSLSEQSKEIENMTNVISDITEQTNLLALNAAIEAARAGEHGKGFAVVADEVRKLAEESNHSAQQIAAVTANIQKEMASVENAIHNNLSSVEQGVTVIEHAGEAFVTITDAIDVMRSQVEDISAVTEEISAATEEVSASVNEIAEGATINAAGAEDATQMIHSQTVAIQEINTVAQTLGDRANELQNTVAQFKI